MSPEIALENINAAKSATYTLVEQYSGGQDQGAYKVVNGDGAAAVLKISKNPMWRPQVERAKAATNHLFTLKYPVPKYLYIDATNDGTFWLESILPGQVIGTPTDAQIIQLLSLIELQKGQAISEVQGQDWSWYAGGVVFRGDSGLVRTLMQFSTETSALAAQIEGLAVGLDTKALGNADLVHGDLGISQVLGENNQISGVLDWDQVGYGDRAMDLVGLWYSLISIPAAGDQVLQAALTVADPQSIRIFAAYKLLASIAWVINRPGGNVSTEIQRAKTGLQIISTI